MTAENKKTKKNFFFIWCVKDEKDGKRKRVAGEKKMKMKRKQWDAQKEEKGEKEKRKMFWMKKFFEKSLTSVFQSLMREREREKGKSFNFLFEWEMTMIIIIINFQNIYFFFFGGNERE